MNRGLILTLVCLLITGGFMAGVMLFDVESVSAAMCSTCNYCKANGTNGSGVCDPGSCMSSSCCAQQCCRVCGSWSSWAGMIGMTLDDSSSGECPGTRTRTCNGVGWSYSCYGGSLWSGWSAYDYSESDGQPCDSGNGVCNAGSCQPAFEDLDLRIRDDLGDIFTPAFELEGETSSTFWINLILLRGSDYKRSVALVEPDRQFASRVLVNTKKGPMAIRKFYYSVSGPVLRGGCVEAGDQVECDVALPKEGGWQSENYCDHISTWFYDVGDHLLLKRKYELRGCLADSDHRPHFYLWSLPGLYDKTEAEKVQLCLTVKNKISFGNNDGTIRVAFGKGYVLGQDDLWANSVVTGSELATGQRVCWNVTNMYFALRIIPDPNYRWVIYGNEPNDNIEIQFHAFSDPDPAKRPKFVFDLY